MERNVFEVDAASNGKYGIEALTKAATLANTVYDLVDKVYLDDRKFGVDDLFDVATIGPGLVKQGQEFGVVAGQVGRELTDLSEAEKLSLRGVAGARVDDPSYQKIFYGMLEVIDGVSEKFNPENPVD